MNCRLLQSCFSILFTLAAAADEPHAESTLLPVSALTPVGFVNGTFAGDVNGDGTEDRLHLVHCWALDGSAWIKQTCLVTRSSALVSYSTVRLSLEKNISTP
jgi:hypothetical protein